jgi:hypothetical protein
MTTQAQVEANRRNAQQSTGPKTHEGKRRVSRNAITHGLDCQEILLPDENRGELLAYRQKMIADHQPVGAEEQDCVERMVSANWRIRRGWRAETGAYAQQRYRLRNPDYDVAACVINDQGKEKAFAYLDRKEAHLSREYARCSKRLQELQDMRRKGTRHEMEEALEPESQEATVGSAVTVAAEAPEVEASNASTASAGGEIQERAEQTQLRGEAAKVEPSQTSTSSTDEGIREIAEQTQLRGEGKRDAA